MDLARLKTVKRRRTDLSVCVWWSGIAVVLQLEGATDPSGRSYSKVVGEGEGGDDGNAE